MFSNLFSSKEFHNLKENVMELKFLPKEYGRKLSVGFFDGSITVFSIEGITHGNLDLKPIYSLEIGQNPIACLSWCKDDKNSLLCAVGLSIKVKKSKDLKKKEFIYNLGFISFYNSL